MAHRSDSSVQRAAEAPILAALGRSLGVTFRQGTEIEIGGSWVKPDGVAADGSVVAEVCARIGKLKPAHLDKVANDALKLIAIRDSHPDARLVLVFADGAAAASISGWRAVALRANYIEIHAVDLDPRERVKIVAAQLRQRMVNVDR